MGVLRMGVLRLEDAHGDKISAQARSDGRRIAAWPWVENVPCRLNACVARVIARSSTRM